MQFPYWWCCTWLLIVRANASTITSTAAALATKTLTVDVGKPSHRFSPNTILAGVGDVIEFHFFPPNHSVVKAEYLEPCVPYESLNGHGTGFSSGFRAPQEIWQLLINDTDPIFFYCSTPDSCNVHQMVGVINPNTNVSLQTQSVLAAQVTNVLQPGDLIPFEAGSTDMPTPSSSLSATSAATATPSNRVLLTGLHHQFPIGAIVGIVLAGVLVVALIAALFFYFGRSKGYSQEPARQASTIRHPSGLLSPQGMTSPPYGHSDVVYSGDGLYEANHIGLKPLGAGRVRHEYSPRPVSLDSP